MVHQDIRILFIPRVRGLFSGSEKLEKVMHFDWESGHEGKKLGVRKQVKKKKIFI